MRYQPPFPAVIPLLRADSHALLTRPPLTRRFVRLACVKHAASVHPEPGSNSPLYPSGPVERITSNPRTCVPAFGPCPLNQTCLSPGFRSAADLAAPAPSPPVGAPFCYRRVHKSASLLHPPLARLQDKPWLSQISDPVRNHPTIERARATPQGRVVRTLSPAASIVRLLLLSFDGTSHLHRCQTLKARPRLVAHQHRSPAAVPACLHRSDP